MTDSIKDTLSKHNIKYNQLEDGTYRLRYDYYDKYQFKNSIWIDTKEVNQRIIIKLIKNRK